MIWTRQIGIEIYAWDWDGGRYILSMQVMSKVVKSVLVTINRDLDHRRPQEGVGGATLPLS